MSKIFDMESVMSFREVSAWVMGLVMLATGLSYAKAAFGAGEPPIAAFVPYFALVIVATIIAQIVLASAMPKAADAPADERERLMLERASHWAGWVLSAGVVVSLGYFLAHEEGDLLFHMVLMSLIVSSVVEYALQAVLLRWGR
jgi:hypothetical protein